MCWWRVWVILVVTLECTRFFAWGLPRKLSWYALVVAPLSPPACLSLKSWPEDPIQCI